MAVGLFVVDEESDRLRRSVLLDDLEVLVEARGVLREVEQDAPSFNGVVLQATVFRVEGLDGGLDRVVSAAHKVGCDAHRKQVVHHVGTAECRADRPCRRGLARARLRAGDVEGKLALAKFHVLRREIERGAREAARRAMPSSQLAVLAEIVFEHRRAQLAHRCVGDRVLRKAHALAHPERNLARPLAPGQLGGALRDGGAQGVVGIEDKDGLRRCGERLDDAVLDAIDFATAIELVAEQVQKKHVCRLELRRHLLQPQLVGFEHAPIGLFRMKKRRRYAGIEVRTRPVAHHAGARALEDIGEQVGHRGLPVGAHHHDRPAGKLSSQVREQTRIHVERNLPREVCRRPVEHVLQAPRRDGAYGLSCGKSNGHGHSSQTRRTSRAICPQSNSTDKRVQRLCATAPKCAEKPKKKEPLLGITAP